MKLNVGGTDRFIRGAVGAALVAGSIMHIIIPASLETVGLIIGAVLLFTAIVGWCPPYSLLGINTRKNS